MKTFSTFLAAVLALGLTFSAVPEAEAAKRLGGGSSSGMQRNTTATNSAPATPPQAPAPTQAAKSPASPANAAAPQTPPKRSWMGPLAGLAAGLGLAALASHFGFGEELASMMMIGLLVMAVLVVVGLVMRRRAASQQPALAAVGGMGYAAAGNAPSRAFDVAMPRAAEVSAGGAASYAAAEAVSAANIPADFDVEGFTRQAKVNFIRLQAANDAGNLDDLREFTTPEMFGELKLNILSRGAGAQQTDVLEINAEVLEVVEEPSRYVVSVRYQGLIREDGNGPTESIAEIWHLVKPRQGNGGWLLAGIQQMQ